ncbi:hypothetical protein BDN72DRAFT_849213 [Pluteus cervinus]|uniref:Uncharacterized protein n=1 Tax=Pluteus cervinus TaxID=181527 RepID=A0ACD3A8A9_9AGAR|nr:hypothetical protein BDN72DRAFT_849213 [Pluteus cervinus]
MVTIHPEGIWSQDSLPMSQIIPIDISDTDTLLWGHEIPGGSGAASNNITNSEQQPALAKGSTNVAEVSLDEVFRQINILKNNATELANNLVTQEANHAERISAIQIELDTQKTAHSQEIDALNQEINDLKGGLQDHETRLGHLEKIVFPISIRAMLDQARVKIWEIYYNKTRDLKTKTPFFMLQRQYQNDVSRKSGPKGFVKGFHAWALKESKLPNLDQTVLDFLFPLPNSSGTDLDTVREQGNEAAHGNYKDDALLCITEDKAPYLQPYRPTLEAVWHLTYDESPADAPEEQEKPEATP